MYTVGNGGKFPIHAIFPTAVPPSVHSLGRHISGASPSAYPFSSASLGSQDPLCVALSVSGCTVNVLSHWRDPAPAATFTCTTPVRGAVFAHFSLRRHKRSRGAQGAAGVGYGAHGAVDSHFSAHAQAAAMGAAAATARGQVRRGAAVTPRPMTPLSPSMALAQNLQQELRPDQGAEGSEARSFDDLERCLCILEENTLHVVADSGIVHEIALPFTALGIWPLQEVPESLIRSLSFFFFCSLYLFFSLLFSFLFH